MSNRMQVIVMYSDFNMWLLPAFLYLWGKYAGAKDYRLTLCGYTPYPYEPGKTYGLEVEHYMIGKQEDYPANRWSDSFRKVMENVADPTFIFMLEDYLLVRDVDNLGVRHLYDYAHDRNYILKIDLTNDRLWSGGGTRYLWGYNTYGHCGHLDLIRSFTGTEYNMSLWGGIFNRDLLTKFLVSGESAQQLELNGTHRVNQEGDSVLVLGSRQSPIKHANVVQGGGINQHETVGMPALEVDDREYVLGLLREHLRSN